MAQPSIVRRALARGGRTLVTAALAVAAAAGCSGDAATAPTGLDPALRKEIVNPPVLASILIRTRPILFLQKTSATIGPDGGSLSLPGAGLKVVIPAGALARNTRISVSAYPGLLVAYGFEPHGIRFQAPLSVTQDLTYTLPLSLVGGTGYEGGYVADESTLDQNSAQALVDEFVPTSVASDGKSVSIAVSHFSGYIIATGRGSY